ncbi:unnamed protein product [Brachionus calyciflorus]|uniref:Fasciculation and elongation protein zeta-2 n=1 Tax=Brachionus calyciflorus TaxID=104777 RepID=A0A814IUQ0_9BILA|nr:unnamed protein product [Brachionus calyciflorus]
MINETSKNSCNNCKMEYFIDESDEDIRAPIANIEIDEFLDNYIYDSNNTTNSTVNNVKKIDNSNLKNSMCNSLEDLVKTFDKNVKECLRSYKNIDIGQLAPVQVRSQDDIINDSQMWYTLTGNFGNLLPIDFNSKKSLIRRYHNDSLNIKNHKSSSKAKNECFDNDLDYYSDVEDILSEANDSIEDYLEFDADEEELKEQLDMHSMILIKSLYNDTELDEPLITAEQVLNEIDSMMNLQDELYDEMTPDSGVYSNGLNTSINSANGDLPIDLSYIKYINTFAQHESNSRNKDDTDETTIQLDHNVLIIPSKKDLSKMNTFELNEIIEQIEGHTKDLSEILVQEFALRDELEFEKETRNTFIALLTSIHEKRRQLCLENLTNHSTTMLLKKKNRKSLNLDSSHLTTVIPYNSDIEYDIPHLQILNKLLKAIDEDSHQVPELLTNYILKVVCPT